MDDITKRIVARLREHVGSSLLEKLTEEVVEDVVGATDQVWQEEGGQRDQEVEQAIVGLEAEVEHGDNEMLDEMIMGLLEERERRCEEEGEREVLRIAAHLIKCKGVMTVMMTGFTGRIATRPALRKPYHIIFQIYLQCKYSGFK